ncbi:Era-like GTP-binding protein [Synechococcus sp. H55.10]|uniref:Era-like GTP-binding protein n=1 Tax=Synechococcus sp. H55.10 TaxID=2964503 RepID=UPI0039C67CD8
MTPPLAQAETVLHSCWDHWQSLARRQDVQPELRALSALRKRLTARLFAIAVFGLVNRGKSAVLNALIGEARLEVGPLNGVTQRPQSLLWQPDPEIPWRVRLVDTPGLNEVEGAAREQLAWDVARSADLILFVIATDLTQLEYQALLELRTLHKPILLVLNKCDLYSEAELQAIRAQISRHLGWVSPQEILTVAACPKPLKVRTHWPDGRITLEWERPAPQIETLRGRIVEILQTEAGSLLALNVLRRLDWVQAQILEKQWQHHARFVEQWGKVVALGKGIAVGLAPLGWDLLLAPLLDGLWLLGLGVRLHLPWEALWKALVSFREGLGRPLLLNGALLLCAEGMSSWLWGDWGNGLLPGLVAGASLYRLGSLAPQALSRFAAQAFGLGASLHALLGREKPATRDGAPPLPSSLA